MTVDVTSESGAIDKDAGDTSGDGQSEGEEGKEEQSSTDGE